MKKDLQNQFKMWAERNGQKPLYLANYCPEYGAPFCVAGTSYYIVPEDALPAALESFSGEQISDQGRIIVDSEWGTLFLTPLAEGMPPEAFPYFFGQNGTLAANFFVTWVVSSSPGLFRAVVTWDDFQTLLPGHGHQAFKMAPHLQGEAC